jgi:hypothetical protein
MAVADQLLDLPLEVEGRAAEKCDVEGFASGIRVPPHDLVARILLN